MLCPLTILKEDSFMSNEELINKIVDAAEQANQLDPQMQRMVVTMFRLLADGKPVSVARFAECA